MPRNDSEDTVLKHMQMLRYATARQMGKLWFGEDDPNKSRNTNQTNAANRLNPLVEEGKLDKVGFKPAVYRLKGLRGEGGKHTLDVTDVLIDILREYPRTIIEREVQLGPNSRADACLIIQAKQKFPLILEVADTEPIKSIQDKIIDYKASKRNWFTERGSKYAGVLVIGDIKIDEEGVVCAKEFKKELLYGADIH